MPRQRLDQRTHNASATRPCCSRRRWSRLVVHRVVTTWRPLLWTAACPRKPYTATGGLDGRLPRLPLTKDSFCKWPREASEGLLGDIGGMVSHLPPAPPLGGIARRLPTITTAYRGVLCVFLAVWRLGATSTQNVFRQTP